MKLLIEPDSQLARRSLWDDRALRLPAIVAAGALPVAVTLIGRPSAGNDSRIFTPLADFADWTEFKAGIGGLSDLTPVGEWPIEFASEAGSLVIPAWPNTQDIQAALDIDSINDAGGVDVSGEEGFFVFTFREPGARSMISGDPASITPISLLDFQRATVGDLDTREVQTLRIRKALAAIADLDEDSEDPEIELEVVQVGDATHNHKVLLTLPAGRWRGAWELSVGDEHSGSMFWMDNYAMIQERLEAMTAIGAGNVTVSPESDDKFLLMFQGDLANTEVEDLEVSSTLESLPEKSGEIDLDVPGIGYLLGNRESVVASLEVEGKAPGADAPTKLFQQAIVLRRPVIAG